jgi:RNA-directed DNA polymerase
MKPSRATPDPRKPLRREGLNSEESEAHMGLEDEQRQKSRQLELPTVDRGEAPRHRRSGESRSATQESGHSGNGDAELLELVVDWKNVEAALRRVRKNKGSPGVDGMTVDELPTYLMQNWSRLREEILSGRYRPQPVRRHAIDKKDGGTRELGIPTVVDRLVQQCILQVLQPRFDPSFSPHSYGFRPGRRAHDAVCAAQRFIYEGRRWVVDVDLEAFFDHVNHDVLMGKLATRIADRRLLRLIRLYLVAGIMASGVVTTRHEGTPQGGPLSPLLANVLLDEVDRELERRGHAFARYADDCNVYVRSKRAGERVLEALRRLYAKLRLRVNEAKSAVARPHERKFLGYSFWLSQGTVKRRVASKALAAMKDRVRAITKRNGGRSIPKVIEELRGYLVGWKNYFRLADTPGIFRELDGWIRHRLRALQLRQWKRGPTICRELIKRGVAPRDARRVAANVGRWWRSSQADLNVALPNSHFDALGVPRLANTSTH